MLRCTEGFQRTDGLPIGPFRTDGPFAFRESAMLILIERESVELVNVHVELVSLVGRFGKYPPLNLKSVNIKNNL
jgi:hypothetical protein